MKKLLSEYWDKFIETDGNGNKKGNGIEFENLVEFLLNAMYGKEWVRTGGSHDDNRDFWLHLSNQSIWAECKNYANTIAMSTLAPTLVMAEIYEVNEILFFSRSSINKFAKDKILTFGEKSNKIVRFFDGYNLEELICTYSLKIPEKYSPREYMITDDMEENKHFVNAYFFRNSISNAYDTSEIFQNYEKIENIYYNENFSLTFCLKNIFQEDKVEVSIEFVDENNERFCFQYFYPTINKSDMLWYHAILKRGEGRSISLNMRQIIYKPEITLPRFRIILKGCESNKYLEWTSKKITVKSSWIGTTRLLGESYLKILNNTEDTLVNNPYLSSLILTGGSGTGKTRVLTECKNIFLKKGYRIVSLSGQKNFSSHYLIKELIAFLYEIPSDEILGMLEEKLFSTKSNKNLSLNTDAEKAIELLKKIVSSNTEELLQEVLDMHSDILYEKFSKNNNVLIIDNIQFTGKAFQNFIEGYVYYALNQQKINKSVLMLAFNTDYITERSSELLYNILHSNIKHCLSYELTGFKQKEQGILFLQELTRTHNDENIEFFSEIIDKISLNPYYLFQTTKYLEESEIIEVLPDKTGYIISNLEKYSILSDISDGIVNVLEKRIQFVYDYISHNRLMLIFSIVYIFDFIDQQVSSIFQISIDELNYLCKRKFLKMNSSGTYVFDHDIVRNFFARQYPKNNLDCLIWLKQKGVESELKKYRNIRLLYEIAVDNNADSILNFSKKLSTNVIPERIASLFYNCLLDAFIKLLESKNYKGIYIKYIHKICTYIRQYDGSLKAWQRARQLYDIIQSYYPNALSEDIKYYRPFIHFCCDIAVQTHLYDEEIKFINEVLEECKNINPNGIENKDELKVLQAIMYNRWYIAYNTQSFKKTIARKRKRLMKKSRAYGDEIVDNKKRGLIEYLNNSDEGYNYYGYQKNKEKLLNIWDKCIIDIPTLVPEKTLNFYRKKAQYGLIEQDADKVEDAINNAMDYLEDGEYSHEPVIFKTFFLMAEIMSNIQQDPEKNYYYNNKIIDDILKMQKLLNNHKLGDILLLKGVNAYYAGNKEEVYYSFKEAYKKYSSGETSRYWIKEKLLIENIKYAFTVLGIYKAGYNMSCFPSECHQPILLFEKNKFLASGIQRTGDLHLNLPLI